MKNLLNCTSILSALLVMLLPLLPASLSAQTAISASDITISGSSTPMSVAWHPSYSRYYASAGGGAGSPVTTVTSSGTFISSTSHNLDNRGLWYNGSANRIEGSQFSSGSLAYYPLDGSGTPSGDAVFFFTGSSALPSGQCGGVRNSSNGEILYYEGTSVFYRYNTSGTQLGTVSITIPGGATFNSTHMIYTGISGREVGFYDFTNLRVYLYSISGGSYVWYYSLPAGAPAPGSYGFAFANDRFFVSSSGTWYGYPISGSAPADPTSASASPNPVCNGFSTSLTAAGAVGTVYWYTGSCGGTLAGTGNPLTVSPTSSTTYYARNYNGSVFSTGCASVTVTVNQPSFTPSAVTVSQLQATGSNIKWYSAASGGTALAGSTAVVNGNHYYASQTVGGVESLTRLDVVATIDQTPCKPTGSASQSLAAGSTVANLSATGTSIRWYAAASGGTALPSSTVLVNGTHYYATQTVSCTESATRLDVVVTLLY